MKLTLLVTQGSAQGKRIPITLPQFIIGRDPQCHLRPASPIISKRHCALIIREGKALIRDFGSTNGSFVNDERLEGERELASGDMLKIGPLAFQVEIEASVPVDKPTPLPTQKPATGDDDEAIANMLLDMKDEGGEEQIDLGSREAVAEGSTILDLPPATQESEQPPSSSGLPKRPQATPGAKAGAKSSTQSAAEEILRNFSRRKKG
jgi:pSer/pThr/pTyr-binding forkhead associated (FHA) protein